MRGVADETVSRDNGKKIRKEEREKKREKKEGLFRSGRLLFLGSDILTYRVYYTFLYAKNEGRESI